MNREEALTKASADYLVAYLLVGITFVVIQFLDSKLRSKYASQGYIVFLVQTAKAIIPLSLLSLILGDVGKSLEESLIVWGFAVFMIYICISPFYFIYWIFKKIFRR